MVRSVFLLACLALTAVRSPAAEPGDWSAPAKYRSWIDAVSWSPDGRTLASAGDNGRIALWDAGTGRSLRQLAGPSTGGIVHPVWSADGTRLLSLSGARQRALVWDAASGKHLRTLLTYENNAIRGCLSPDGARAYLGTFRGGVLVWDAGTGELLPPLDGTHAKMVVALAVSGDGATLVSGSEDGTAIVWDLAAG